MPDIKVFIGTEPKTEIARKVLQHSIQRRTTSIVTFTPMIGAEWEYATEGIQVGTGFSLRRWMIPEACNWQGHAIYLDADQIVFKDIAGLLQMGIDAMRDKTSAAMTYQPDKFNPKPWPQSSVMVIDCLKAKNHFEWSRRYMFDWLKKHPTKQAYAEFMHAKWMQPTPGILPIEWNHLNVYNPNTTALLHYTKEPEQPWYKPDHPLAYLWIEEFKHAYRNAIITKAEVKDAVAKFNVKEDWRNTNGLHPVYLDHIKGL